MVSPLDHLADRLTSIERRLSARNTPQLAHSSIVDGSIEQVKLVDTGELDENGFPIYERELVARIGEQPDGSNGIAVFDGPEPPRPMNFSVTGGPGLMTVEWYGEFEDAFEPYVDHAYVAVHLSPDPDFIPTADTLKATIEAPQGGVVTIGGLEEGAYYVTLVSVSQAGRWSTPAPIDGDDTTPQLDPVWISSVEAKADEALETARGVDAKAEQAKADALEAYNNASAAARAATDADAKATRSLLAADGKTTVTWSINPPGETAEMVDNEIVWTDDPNNTTSKMGDLWYVREGMAIKYVFEFDAQFKRWRARKMTSQTIDSITAGQITTGILGVGQQIITGDPYGTHTVLGSSSLVTYRVVEEQDEDPDAPPPEAVPTVSIGGETDDVVQLMNPSTQEMFGFDASGAGSWREVSTNTLYVDGYPIGTTSRDDLLWRLPRGYIAGYRPRSNSPEFGVGQLGICEVTAPLNTARLYRVRWSGNFISSTTSGSIRLFLRYRADDGTAVTIANTTQLTMGAYPVTGATNHLDIEGYIFGPSFDGQVFRFLLTAQKLQGGGTGTYSADGGLTPGILYVEDIGPAVTGDGTGIYDSGSQTSAGGTPAGGSAQVGSSTAKTTMTRTYNASWSRTWRGNTGLSSGELRSGNGNLRSAVGFPSTVQSDIAGANIHRVELYLYANHWYYGSGGTAVIGLHNKASSQVPWVDGIGVSTTYKWNTKSGGRWITLPASWYPAFSAGTARGITYGDGAPASNAYYSRVNGYGMNYRPQLRITYSR